MKRKTILLMSVVILYFLIKIIDFIYNPNIYSTDNYTDLYSGDIKVEKYFLSLKIKEDIYLTEFSNEVRRLGINIPDNRKWSSRNSEKYSLGLFPELIDGVGLYIEVYLNMIMSDFIKYKISDSVRITIIQEVLSCIKNNNAQEVRIALKDIVKKFEEGITGVDNGKAN